MKHVFALCIVLSLLPQAALAQGCVMDMREFDYMETSPQEFMQGTPEQVRSAYSALQDHVGDTGSIVRATQYFVDSAEFATITSRECDGDFCRGRDLVQGHVECAQKAGVLCLALAAIKDGTIYCTLKPAFEHTIDQPLFQPFE